MHISDTSLLPSFLLQLTNLMIIRHDPDSVNYISKIDTFMLLPSLPQTPPPPPPPPIFLPLHHHPQISNIYLDNNKFADIWWIKLISSIKLRNGGGMYYRRYIFTSSFWRCYTIDVTNTYAKCMYTYSSVTPYNNKTSLEQATFI